MSALLQFGLGRRHHRAAAVRRDPALGVALFVGRDGAGSARRASAAVGGPARRPRGSARAVARAAAARPAADARGPGRAASLRWRPMRLTAWEEERLLIFTAAELARRHRARGLAAERARGDRAHLRRDARGGPGRRALRGRRGGRARGRRPRRGHPGVRALVDEVRLEVLMDDGTRLVVARRPARPRRRWPRRRRRRPGARSAPSDRRDPTRVGRARPDRARRCAATSTRVDPRVLALPVRTGQRAARVRSRGGARLPARPAGRRDRALGAGRDADGRLVASVATRRATGVSRALAAAERLARYGPTTGDRVRLGDTDLWVRVAEDRQAPGDEPHWGYAKTIRPRSTQGRGRPSELDVVVAGALVIDPIDRRRQGRHRDQGRPDRRRRAGRATPRSATGSSSRSGRTPRRSWATA